MLHVCNKPRSAYWILYSLLPIIGIIIARLFYLQIHLNSSLKAQSEKNYLRIEYIKAPRGNILDINGKLLATNQPITHLQWNGSGNYNLSNDQLNVLKQIESILGYSALDNPQHVIQIRQAERFSKTCLLAKELSFEQLSKIKEQFPTNPNVSLCCDFKRYYPYKQYACHILGYLGSLDLQLVGKMGLEKLLHTSLEGEYGQILKTINSTGKDISRIELKKALHGNNIQTTIDIDLQELAESLFPQHRIGTFIIMNPKNGQINALLSRPNFDPSLFLKSIGSLEWDALQEQRPFINRAFNAHYPPGSLFKLVSTAAAVEEGLIKSDSIWNCKGYVWCGKRKFWCNKKFGHNEINTLNSLAQSCNIMFYQIGKKLDIDIIADYAHRFGLGQKTDMIFHEKIGFIPTRQWKHTFKGERWWLGETLSVMIGQSYVQVTPIQIARMIASIFTGYLVTPHILINEVTTTKPINIKESTRSLLKKSMKKVVSKGTGQRLKPLKDITIYAKTSTAQTSDLKKRKLGDKYLEHGWFAGYFSYKNEGPYVLVILVENAGSARVTTNIAKDFLIAYKKLIDAKKPNSFITSNSYT